MFDLKLIRQDPDNFDAQLARRGHAPVAATIVAVDAERRELQTEIQAGLARRNAASKAIGMAMKDGRRDEAEALKAEVTAIKDRGQELESREKELDSQLQDILAGLPNIPYDDVPEGADEDDNVEIRLEGDIPDFDFDAKEHFDLGEALGQMDFESAVRLSGSRFVALKGSLARLSRALGQFMLDTHISEFGYTEIVSPVLVRAEALYGTGQLPKFEEDLFKTTGDHYLIPTAEATLTNLHMGEIIDADQLPLRYTALSNCFRSEAGAAGRDTRGMIRQHQFDKVEMVSLVTPESSDAELERMTGAAETILKKLGLAYRVMKLCTGDMGFSARRTYDLEVWLPGQGRYREISSCSVCGDFQARRSNMRFRAKGEKQTQFVHTLNGSGLAVGRTLIAVMENYQNADGSIRVPEVLQPYMGGIAVIGA